MIDFNPLIRRLAGTPLAAWADTLPQQFADKLACGHGDLARWRQALDALPSRVVFLLWSVYAPQKPCS